MLALVLFAMCFTVQRMFAADGDPATPPPADLLGWVNLIIVALTPIVIAGIKKLAPRIPTMLLPFIAPLIGLALNYIASFATGHAANPIVGAVAGALGVWLRELVDQTKKKVVETA